MPYQSREMTMAFPASAGMPIVAQSNLGGCGILSSLGQRQRPARFRRPLAYRPRTESSSPPSDYSAVGSALPTGNFPIHSLHPHRSGRASSLLAAPPYPKGSCRMIATDRKRECPARHKKGICGCSGSDSAPSSLPKNYRFGSDYRALFERGASDFFGWSKQLSSIFLGHFSGGMAALKKWFRKTRTGSGSWIKPCLERALYANHKARVNGVLRPVKGLTLRRQRERALCLRGL